MSEEKVYIGLGGNVGEPIVAMRQALRLIEERGLGRVARVSSFYRTEPVGLVEQPWFVNAAAEIETGVAAEELRAGLREIERELGREEERVKNGPRPLDLDVLLMGERVIESAALTVPHPRMHERRFVLEPLAEIAPEARHPVLGKRVRELLAELGDRSSVEKLAAGQG
ncbi:MAG TPA: 2-amino-4-hydroxy-6-hydroxymethyldihydropteridine diphosphokinase [bacterium]|nr:2-amino-4-hydroxy-6-hydroxymethyldihydropteridine diphosphokinase [bacterium]